MSVSVFVFLNLCIVERDKLTSTTKESSRVKILCQDFESGSMVKTQYQRSLTATRLSHYCRLYLVTLVQKIENAIAIPKWEKLQIAKLYMDQSPVIFLFLISCTARLLLYIIIHMKKLLDADWLRAVQFKCNTSAKSVTPVQITHRNSGL